MTSRYISMHSRSRAGHQLQHLLGGLAQFLDLVGSRLRGAGGEGGLGAQPGRGRCGCVRGKGTAHYTRIFALSRSPTGIR